MATSEATIQYILEQVSAAGNIRVRKMFGEYALYCDDKVVGLVCEDQLFIKYTDPGKVFAEGRFSEGYAYPGAKPSMNVSDAIDDSEFISLLIRKTADALPMPVKKKKFSHLK